MVGSGYWGRNIVPNFAEIGALAAICDCDEELAHRIAAEHASVPMRWHDILADMAISAVAIAAPAAATLAMVMPLNGSPRF